MVRVPVAPQVQPQVQQEQVAAPQFQAAPSPGMQSAMQLGQDLMRAGQMAMELQRDERAMELWRAKEERREQIVQGREAEAAAKEAERLKAKADDIVVDGAIGVVAGQIGEVVDIYGRTTGRESLDRWKESSTVIDGLVKDMRDKLQDELQIKMFDVMVDGRIRSAKRTINDHYAKQLDSEQAIARAGRLGTLGQEFARSSEIQDVYTAAAAAEENIRLQYTAPSGAVNEDMARAATQDWYRSYLPVLVDRRVANNDHAGAHMVVKVLDEGGRLDAALADKLQDQITNAEEIYSANEAAKNLVSVGSTGGLTQFASTAPDPNAKPLARTFDGKPNYNAILDVINGADRRDSWKEIARSAVSGMERDQVQAEQRAYRDLLRQAESIALSDRAIADNKSYWTEIPQEIWSKLRLEDQNRLKNITVVSDEATLGGLLVSLGSVQPENTEAVKEFAVEVDKAVASGRINKKDADALIMSATEPRKIIEAKLDNDQITAVFASEGLVVDDTQRAVARYRISSRITEMQTMLGRPLTSPEKEDVIREMLKVNYIKTGMVVDDVERSLFVSQPDQYSQVSVDVSGKKLTMHRPYYEAALLAAKMSLEEQGQYGVYPTPQQIVETYNKMMKRNEPGDGVREQHMFVPALNVPR